MNNESSVIKELQQLRKGSGLQPWKLQETVALRRVIARQLNLREERLSLDQLYDFLLSELIDLGEGDVVLALRYAYGVGTGFKLPSLTDRRQDLALQLGKHPDTIKAKEDRAILQLAQHLCKPRQRHDIEERSHEKGLLPGLDTMAKALQKSAIESLSGLYSVGIHGPELLKLFGRNRYLYQNVTVEAILSQSSRGDDWYTYHFRYRFHAPKEVFRIGVTASFEDAGILMDSGLFDEVTCLDAGASFEDEMQNLLGSWRFTVHDSQTGTKKTFWFFEMEPEARRLFMQPIWQLDADACRVLEVHIPAEYTGEMTYYELYTKTDYLVSEPFAYWEAPGLMHVSTVIIDVSNFPNRDKWKFYLKPFLGTTATGPAKELDGRYTFTLNSWIVHGHGVSISWKAEN